jgi:hypothetical protein
MPTPRVLLRLTRRIHAAYERQIQYREWAYQSESQRLEDLVEQVARHQRLFAKATRRGWRLAAHVLVGKLSANLRTLCDIATNWRVQWLDRPLACPAHKELFTELMHAQAEFGELINESDPPSIAVESDAIVLEGVELGRFLIRLDWPRLEIQAGSECFEVIALEPNPPTSDSSVTHPHVKDHRLCAGDATVPIQNALEQGRIADAFCLVRSVLETYGKNSPYVPLENWNGVRCWNCDHVAQGNDTYCCERCKHEICSECVSSCDFCYRSLCASCQTHCSDCNGVCCLRCLTTSARSENASCKSCLKVCAICGAKVAASDFDDATERCSRCNEEGPLQETEGPEPTLPPTSSGETDDCAPNMST